MGENKYQNWFNENMGVFTAIGAITGAIALLWSIQGWGWIADYWISITIGSLTVLCAFSFLKIFFIQRTIKVEIDDFEDYISGLNDDKKNINNRLEEVEKELKSQCNKQKENYVDIQRLLLSLDDAKINLVSKEEAKQRSKKRNMLP